MVIIDFFYIFGFYIGWVVRQEKKIRPVSLCWEGLGLISLISGLKPRSFFRLLRQFGRFLIAAQLFQLFDSQRRGHVMASEKWRIFSPWHATTEEFILQEI